MIIYQYPKKAFIIKIQDRFNKYKKMKIKANQKTNIIVLKKMEVITCRTNIKGVKNRCLISNINMRNRRVWYEYACKLKIYIINLYTLYACNFIFY